MGRKQKRLYREGELAVEKEFIRRCAEAGAMTKKEVRAVMDQFMRDMGMDPDNLVLEPAPPDMKYFEDMSLAEFVRCVNTRH